MALSTVFLAQSALSRSPGTIVGLIILILNIAVIVSVLAGKGTVGHKMLWSLLVFFLPVIGLVLYFAVGRNRADRPLME